MAYISKYKSKRKFAIVFVSIVVLTVIFITFIHLYYLNNKKEKLSTGTEPYVVVQPQKSFENEDSPDKSTDIKNKNKSANEKLISAVNNVEEMNEKEDSDAGASEYFSAVTSQNEESSNHEQQFDVYLEHIVSDDESTIYQSCSYVRDADDLDTTSDEVWFDIKNGIEDSNETPVDDTAADKPATGLFSWLSFFLG